ncbi:MAG: FAD-binding protein [Chloroflexota bacterium]
MNLQPTSVEELQHIVKSEQNLVPRGSGSKPTLSMPQDGQLSLDLSALTGIIEYDPDEYTFTAYAGTPLSDIENALAEYGQYLPFDPMLVKRGATLGGTVAANLSGSGRYRYGGVRDFILGVRFVDGRGQLVSGGGKVVKNSAGFDIPKFMVGSLGRYGIFTTFSFKVFPQPKTYVTLKAIYVDLDQALQAIFCLAPTPFEMDALDLEPATPDQWSLLIRLGGLPDALPNRLDRLQDFLQSQTDVQTVDTLVDQADTDLWDSINAASWVEEGENLIKIPLAPKQIPALEQQTVSAKCRYSTGGGIAWVATKSDVKLDQTLTDLGLVGLQLFGIGEPYLGQRKGLALMQRVKNALDPEETFTPNL